MGILSGPEIRDAVSSGRIHISPFNEGSLGPNSYDLQLGEKLTMYRNGEELDAKKDNETYSLIMPEDGFVLTPGQLYLGHTIEEAGSDYYVPCIEGRSSVARLGISPHVSAGFGDHGFKRQWTLEITVTNNIRVYPGMRICQVYFLELVGDRKPYQGKYVNSHGVQPSKMHEDFL